MLLQDSSLPTTARRFDLYHLLRFSVNLECPGVSLHLLLLLTVMVQSPEVTGVLDSFRMVPCQASHQLSVKSSCMLRLLTRVFYLGGAVQFQIERLVRDKNSVSQVVVRNIYIFSNDHI